MATLLHWLKHTENLRISKEIIHENQFIRSAIPLNASNINYRQAQIHFCRYGLKQSLFLSYIAYGATKVDSFDSCFATCAVQHRISLAPLYLELEQNQLGARSQGWNFSRFGFSQASGAKIAQDNFRHNRNDYYYRRFSFSEKTKLNVSRFSLQTHKTNKCGNVMKLLLCIDLSIPRHAQSHPIPLQTKVFQYIKFIITKMIIC